MKRTVREEPELQLAIKTAWLEGGDATVIRCGPHQKTAMRERFRGYSKAFSLYFSDFGTHRVVVDEGMEFFKLFHGPQELTPEYLATCEAARSTP